MFSKETENSLDTSAKLSQFVFLLFPVLFPMGQTQESLRSAATGDSISFSFIYLAHPRSVTGISWRKTSKYMPK